MTPQTATEVEVRSLPRIASPDVLTDLHIKGHELLSLLDLAAEVKRNPSRFKPALAGKSIGIFFEKPSLRTRLTFELAIQQLGGFPVSGEGTIAEREPVKDVARNLDRWVNAIVARVFSHNTLVELARWSSVPVINALCNMYHPCQAFADLLTFSEKYNGQVRGRTIAFVGDGNNVATSLMLTALRLGVNFTLATPPGYEPKKEVLDQGLVLSESSDSKLWLTNNPAEAVNGADAVYTDVWTSMGQEKEEDKRLRDFAGFSVNEKLFSLAKPEAVFMHCLPAQRGKEVTDEVMESPRSVVFDQAENRLHVQKALLLMML
jgi:ornithine carbamoyltransferase